MAESNRHFSLRADLARKIPEKDSPNPLRSHELSFPSSALISQGPDTDNLPVKVIRVKGKNYVIRYPGVCT